MAELDENERRIINEFCQLQEKSKQLFNGLRDLPQYGHKQWQAYFGRTFDVYTKLWKFQQQHRQILDVKYDLKRWQIGEIASKIGQLYYHYYLRTSETNYLNEAFSFYSAIRARSYYSRITKEDHHGGSKSDLVVKKLRYYARFIVVCLLLKKMKLVRELVRELSKYVDEYTSTYEPDDQLEWSLVLGEIKSFLEADAILNILDADSNPMVISHRLSPLTTPPVEKCPAMDLTLQEVLIFGNNNDQVKFSELTLDMFRILQTLEREPQEDASYQAYSLPSRAPSMEANDRPLKRENPHKYLLYKPTLSQLLVFLASGFKELPLNGALLLYISADGLFPSSSSTEDRYDMGGVCTNSKREPDQSGIKRGSQVKELNCLYPGDLIPFMRKPLFLIVDSDNSWVFQSVPQLFGQPLVILMSPQDVPSQYQDLHPKGGLLTLFLHSPLTAICVLGKIREIPYHLWETGQAFVDRFLAEASRLLTRVKGIESSYLPFLGDDFLRLLLLRFIFCCVALRLHRAFKHWPALLPRSQPPLPESELLLQSSLERAMYTLVDHLELSSIFIEPSREIL
uniref:Protein SCAI n=1 Tax=Daphnia galeata TaxID=27404 RepID=A0A8J2RFA5_9CRUS|nr:unnamed protein product [Daphnia galeata]